jgi:hypothetical protein
MRTYIEMDGIQFRYRSASGLRRFAANFDLHEDEAVFDRIVLDVTVDISYQNSALLGTYVEHVSGRSGSLPWTFLSIDQLASNYRPKVRKAVPSEVHGGDWIVGVEGTLSNGRQERGGIASLKLTLHVNLTTFLANLSEPELADLDNLQPTDAFLANPVLLAKARANSSDGKDNFLVGSARRGGRSFCGRDQWSASVIAAFFSKLDDFLRRQLIPDQTNGLPSVRVAIRPWTVSQAEVYWEFESNDAISDVLTIGDRLSLAAGRVSVRRYYTDVRHIALGHDENGASVSIDLTRSSGRAQLIIYAKSRKVVRVEVRYLKQLRQTVARHARGELPVYTMLDLIRRHAVQQVATVRSAIVEMTPNIHERADIVTFVRLVAAAAAGNREVEEGLTTLLVNIGAVSQTEGDGVCPPAVSARLVRNGVLQRVRVRHGGPPRFALTPAYAALVRDLNALRPSHRELQAERGEHRLS